MNINKYKQLVSEFIQDIKYFDLNVGFKRAACTFNENKQKYLIKRNDAFVMYLEKNFIDLLNAYKSCDESLLSDNEGPIWVFWWQGKEKMPPLIDACLKSKLRYTKGRNVIVLDKNNVFDYVNLSDELCKAFASGKIKIQHFADIVRVNLINQHGGLWLDASIFCTSEIPEECFKYSFFSLKGNPDYDYVSENKWTTFVIGGSKNNALCAFLSEFFDMYIKKNKPFIDYFMFDCAISLAYRNIPLIRDEIDNLPKYESDCYWLSNNLKSKFEDIKVVMDQYKMPFNKLAWKQDIHDKKSVYVAIEKGELL